jgi:spermidine synthase
MEPLVIRHEQGSRVAYRGQHNIAREGQGDSVAYVQWLLELYQQGVQLGTVAHIGGGFCVMPRLMPNFAHTVFEIEPELAEFARDFTFILGDWHDTLMGTFDVILYDTGHLPDPEEVTKLHSHLTEGGILLGVDS